MGTGSCTKSPAWEERGGHGREEHGGGGHGQEEQGGHGREKQGDHGWEERGGHGREEQGGHGWEEQGGHGRVEHGGGVTSGRNRGDHGWVERGVMGRRSRGGHGQEERGGGVTGRSTGVTGGRSTGRSRVAGAWGGHGPSAQCLPATPLPLEPPSPAPAEVPRGHSRTVYGLTRPLNPFSSPQRRSPQNAGLSRSALCTGLRWGGSHTP